MAYAWPVDDVMDTFRRLHAEWHGRDDRIRIVTAPDWTPACSDDLYRRARREADDHGTGMITHALETRAEMMFNLEHHGKPAVRRLGDLGVLGLIWGSGRSSCRRPGRRPPRSRIGAQERAVRRRARRSPPAPRAR